jgi:hypothetical protein|tara:strand:- start:618 stop:872 length:255 start_codon:yes stop_codon:yes gene_type:complete
MDIQSKETNEDLYVCFLWQALTSGYYAPSAIDDLEEALRLSREIIKEHSDDFNLANLNKKVIKLLVTNDKPAMLKGGIVVNRTN